MFDRLTQCACQDSERIAVNFTRFDSNREITFENSSYFNFNTLSPLLTIQNKNTMEDKKEKEKAGSSGAPVSYNQVFEEKFRSILFPEPYFSEYLRVSKCATLCRQRHL